MDSQRGCIVSAGNGDLHQFDDLSREERHPMYQVSLAWQWSDDLLAWGSWSNGAKAGGFDFLYEGADDETYNVLTSVIPLAPGGAFASVRGKGREVYLEARYRF